MEQSGLLWVHPNPQASLDVDELLGPLAEEFPSFGMQTQVFRFKRPEKILTEICLTILSRETYHFGKLQKRHSRPSLLRQKTLFEEFGRHHFFTKFRELMKGILPESDWDMGKCTFFLYKLFQRAAHNE
ncbi:MAG: hypothetical protein CM15mP120_10070 [Pseudomonadota bacterium]|nr:MAG: hypothetical protein CM15mP120_10070 [Pseudomonadota bacterium]